MNLESCFTKQQFKSKMFAGLEKWNKSYISRVRNALVKATTDNNGILPQYIILVLDNEMINTVSYRGFGFSDIITRIYKWLAVQIDRIVSGAKDMLSAKAKRKFEPHILWMAIPEHNDLVDNYKRCRVNEITEQVLESFQDMKILKPIKRWNIAEKELISSSGNTCTGEGVSRIWQAIDAAIRYWETAKSNPLRVLGYQRNFNHGQHQGRGGTGHHGYGLKDKFHWNRNANAHLPH